MFNIFHKHKLELVAIDNTYHFMYKDQNNKKAYKEMRFYKCKCGKRASSNNLDKYDRHPGIAQAQKNLEEAGLLPTSSCHPEDDANFKTPDEVTQAKLDPVLEYQKTLNDISESLKVVLNRDFDLEAKYPKLKKLADQYHHELAKHRTYDTLKDKIND
jgi:hypothetical protein